MLIDAGGNGDKRCLTSHPIFIKDIQKGDWNPYNVQSISRGTSGIDWSTKE